MSATVVVIRYGNASVMTVKKEKEEVGTVIEVLVDGHSVYRIAELDEKIENLKLSDRPYHCLRRAQIPSIGELVKRSKQDLLYITNFGPKCLVEVVAKLEQLGLSLSLTDYRGPSRR